MINLSPADSHLIDKINDEIEGSISNKSLCVSIKKNNNVIGLFEFQPITNVCWNVHLHIFKKYQGKGIALECLEPLKGLAQSIGLNTILATIPKHNEQMLKVINKTNFNLCGVLKNSIVYKGQLQDLFLFELEV